MKLLRREKAALFLGGMSTEIFLEAGRLALSLPLAREGQPLVACSQGMVIPALRTACDTARLAAIESQLQAVGTVFLVAELGVLAGFVVLAWWLQHRK